MKTLFLAAMLVAALPARLVGQAGADEMTQIQQRLAALQQQALRDSGVVAAQETFSAELNAAMVSLDDAAAARMARARALEAEVETARAASDNAKLNQLAAEAGELQQYFEGLRTRALARSEVQERRRAYLAVLLSRMEEIDPQVPALMARLQELRAAGH